MNEAYENKVREWYIKLRDPFTHSLVQKLSYLSLDMAENIYQDAFIAVHDNIQKGRVKEDTSWSSYIYTIAFNLAAKEGRHSGVMDSIDLLDEDDEAINGKSRKLRNHISQLFEEECSRYDDPKVKAALGEEIAHTPEPCKSIITQFYWDDASLNTIAVNIGFKNSNTVKAKKSQCMKDLTKRVKELFKRAGFDF